MSRTDTWMPLYVGDYLADTGRLTTVGHGAYLLILMDYWRNGPPPDDDAALAAIARVERKVWDRELKTVIRSFFKLGGDGLLHQKRLDKERAHAIELSDKRRIAAQSKRTPKGMSADSDSGPNGVSGGNNGSGKVHANHEQLLSNSFAKDDDLLSICDDNSGHDCLTNCEYTRASRPYASPSPSPLQEKEEKEESTPKPPRGLASDADSGLDEFWRLYPRKEGKGHARAAFLKALRKTTAAEIIAGLQAYRFTENPRFIPYPASWLNGEFWLQADDADDMDPVLKAAGVTQADLDRHFAKADDQTPFPSLRFLQ